MNQRHKHYDCIVAWAEGEKIEMLISGVWYPVPEHPKWHDINEYRIKPKTVKKEGWVNVYKGGHRPDYFDSYEGALEYNPFNKQHIRIDTIRIEWEEEQ
jgi:hypothetical protein